MSKLHYEGMHTATLDSLDTNMLTHWTGGKMKDATTSDFGNEGTVLWFDHRKSDVLTSVRVDGKCFL